MKKTLEAFFGGGSRGSETGKQTNSGATMAVWRIEANGKSQGKTIHKYDG